MERPTEEQVAAAREYLLEHHVLFGPYSTRCLSCGGRWPCEVRLILAHLDAVEAERDANRHELDQLVQETLIPLQQELAEARGRIEALSTLLEWNREAMEAFGVTGGPDITDAIQWSQQQKQELAEARSAIRQVYGAAIAWRISGWRDLPAVQRAMEEANDAHVPGA